ncbi:DUF4168 domain-containing protein [Leptolyngbya cf. ectocarpi LEGE 11479]|uniref:DUF4168 domain-containing protein n=1 Tax=Leptolyngbya cf. ectocarpi LEGE 11479 TaxID=1828722 RepID=A0A928ZQM8_LEPEC|nr:DUF4168 domain-containing protein [Leptolyngbya ectocarpi]MBE9066400.1 DUF4168 domain-containing protein [Leptolyngbya cf. ectocarpi LEGE 11479]
MMLSRCSSHDSPPRRHWRVGIRIGFAIALGWPLSTLWQHGYAQNFTDEEVVNYATAVLAMESSRQQAYAEIADLMSGAGLDVLRYDLRCLSLDALELPRAVRRPVRYLLINYCNDAKEIVEETGLTVQTFNSITVNHQEDETLAEKIQSELSRLQ